MDISGVHWFSYEADTSEASRGSARGIARCTCYLIGCFRAEYINVFSCLSTQLFRTLMPILHYSSHTRIAITFKCEEVHAGFDLNFVITAHEALWFV